VAGPTDDRNRPCRIAELSAVQIGRRALGISWFFDAETKRELRVTDTLETMCAIAGGVVGAIAWQLAWSAQRPFGLLGLCGGFIIVPPLIGTLTWWVSLNAVRRRRFRRLAGDFLAEARCPACRPALQGLAPHDDGCIVCPECGAAWRRDRLEAAGAESDGGGAPQRPE
jgi:hypothetical protein